MGSTDDHDQCMDLPPGFRFHPTDEEIISHYLTPKVINHGFNARAVGQVDLNKCEPWDLPSKAKMGEKEWYFFCQRDRKYPTGMRTNRATESGYWKATGKDKEVFRGKGVLVGMKKTLVFYRGRAPKGEKTNWVMHEYRLEGRTPLHNLPKTAKDEWVVCRVFHKSTAGGVMVKIKSPMVNLAGRTTANSLLGDHHELLDSTTLPPLMDPMAAGFITTTDHGHHDHHEGFYFKGIPTISSINTPVLPSNYFLSSTSMLPMDQEPHQNNNIINNPPLLYPQVAPCSSNLGYLHHEQALIRALVATSDASSSPLIGRQCKVEQLSNQSMLSQDTGLSTDRNTEISSVNVSRSKHEINNYGSSLRSYDDLDLENLWKY